MKVVGQVAFFLFLVVSNGVVWWPESCLGSSSVYRDGRDKGKKTDVED